MKSVEIYETVKGDIQVEERETSGLRQCHACHYELRNRDKFCRRCGTRQTDSAAFIPNRYITSNLISGTPDFYLTSPLSKPQPSHLVSGALMTGIIASTQQGVSHFQSNFARAFITSLLILPLCLIIILLSPFDAYLAAKAAYGHH